MGKTNKKYGRLRFDVPSPPQGVPWLVYPYQGTQEEQQIFYSIVDGRVEERSNKLLRSSLCVATARSWMLLQNMKTRTSLLFNPFSSQEHPLPRLIGEYPNIMLVVSDPGKADCFVVGIYEEEQSYLLYTSPRGRNWRKLKLDIWQDCYSATIGAASCNGKLYLLTSDFVLAVIQFTPNGPVVEKLNTKKPERYFLQRRCCHIYTLVASAGELFLVDTIAYLTHDSRLLKTLLVFKLDCFNMTWSRAETLNESVFVMSRQYSSSFLAANTKLKGNCIYCVSQNVLYCFDMEYKSFTLTYPLSDAAYNECLHFWLVPDVEQINLRHKGNHIREDIAPNMIARSYEKFLFDHPKFLSPPTSSTCCSIQRSKLWPKWHPRTPLLMFTHKEDGTYKVLDPCKKVAYELHVPDLAGYTILASVNGWLFAKRRPFYFILIDPFSKEKIDLPHSNHEPFCVAFSAPPTSSECKVFFISHLFPSKSTVKISMHQLGDDKWITREFEDLTTSFRLAHSNGVYFNECFYSLGMNGNLGVYDPTKDSWKVLTTHVNIEREAYFYILVKSRSKLLSVFIDLFQRPIGMFEYDLDLWQWKKVTDMGDRTFFYGQETSFCATASNESMRSKVYFPRFHTECSLDLVAYPLSQGSSPGSSINAKTEYVHVWIEPNMGDLWSLNSSTNYKERFSFV